MADHFDKIQKLPDPVVGAPNFHRIPGYKVYCTGQPTAQGFKNILEKVTGKIYPKEGKIIWLNLRQEPSVYVNGVPICARPPNEIGEYAELGNVTRDSVKADEVEFKKVVDGRVKENGGKLPGRVNSQSIPVDHFPVSMGLLVQHDQRTNFYLWYIRSKNHLCTCTFQPES